jgi:hypothetical protein
MMFWAVVILLGVLAAVLSWRTARRSLDDANR